MPTQCGGSLQPWAAGLAGSCGEAMLVDVLCHRFQQGIDGLCLDPVGWIPVMPCCRWMLGKNQIWFVYQETQKVSDLFFKYLATCSGILNRIKQVEFESVVYFDGTGWDSRFFLGLSQGGFKKRFSRLTVAFW